MRQLKVAWHDVLHADTLLFEITLSLMAVGWGGWLVLPWASFTIGPTFDVFEKLMPEVVWGWTFVAFGLLHLMRLRAQRRVVWLFGFWLWLVVALLYWLGNPSSPGVPMFGILAASYGFLYLRNGGHHL